ncbi:YccF domain-containing protein [Nocardioides sp. YIM 152588]|uniref:YccF domain-containing protein n=1 Tax=Nocardioides sp. YIM 152588 TaxID=3158259 RepID=UPI0032E3D668
MTTLLNVIWLVLSGFWMFLGYMLVGALWCITIIGIPFGIASFRIGLYALWPFGRTIVPKPGAGAGSAIGNVLWFVLSGIWLAIGHAISGVALCLTIIGIPLGLASFKLIPISLFPLGKDIVRIDDLRAGYAAGPVVPPTQAR